MIVKYIKIPDPLTQDLVSLDRLNDRIFSFDRESFINIGIIPDKLEFIIFHPVDDSHMFLLFCFYIFHDKYLIKGIKINLNGLFYKF